MRRTPALILLTLAACSTPPRDLDGGVPDSGETDGGGNTDGGDLWDAGARDGGGQGLRGYGFDYRYGNQIFGSYLELDAGGVIARRERNCCPPATVDAGVTALTPGEASFVGDLLAPCDSRPPDRFLPDAGGAAGDLYGSFELIGVDGGRTVLRYEALEAGNVHAVYRNPCSTLPQLINFVNDRVDRDMPVDL